MGWCGAAFASGANPARGVAAASAAMTVFIRVLQRDAPQALHTNDRGERGLNFACTATVGISRLAFPSPPAKRRAQCAASFTPPLTSTSASTRSWLSGAARRPTSTRPWPGSSRPCAPKDCRLCCAIPSDSTAWRWTRFSIRVSPREIQAGVDACPADVKDAIAFAAERIRAYHLRQRPDRRALQGRRGRG